MVGIIRKEEEPAGWLAHALVHLAMVWSHATADQANGGWFPTGGVAVEGHGWVLLSTPCVRRPSSLPRTPPPELVTGRRTAQGQLPLLESEQKKTKPKKASTTANTLHPRVKLKTLRTDVQRERRHHGRTHR